MPTRCEDLLAAAASHRASGEPGKAEAALRAAIAAAIKSGAPAAIAAGAAAQHELALLLSLSGRHADADAVLRALNLHHKLAPGVFVPTPSPALESREAVPHRPVVIDHALPGAMVDGLRLGLGRDAAFWQEHCYPTPGFFSYRYPLEQPARLLVERAAQALLPLMRRHWPRAAAPPAVVEWWAHARTADGGHQLHFDMDEEALRRSGRASHPTLSAVLYLSAEQECSLQPPTLVTSQALGGGEAEAEAEACPPQKKPRAGATARQPSLESAAGAVGWLVHPRPNRLLLFRGDRLHGVVPRLPRADAAAAGQRLTLMFGWWPADAAPRPAAAPTRPRGAPGLAPLHPCMHPPNPAARTAPAWARELATRADGAAEAEEDGQPLSAAPGAPPAGVLSVGRVWHAVAPAHGGGGGGGGDEPTSARLLEQLGEGSVEFVGRFFLRCLEQIDEEVLCAAPGASGGAEDGAGGAGGEAEEAEEYMDLAAAIALAEKQRAGGAGSTPKPKGKAKATSSRKSKSK